MENTTKTQATDQQPVVENRVKNAGKIQNKKKVQKKSKSAKLRAEIIKARTEESLTAIEASLEKLRGNVIKSSIGDKEIVKRYLRKIIELKNDGVSLENIYSLLKESAKLQISFSTFRYYVSKQTEKPDGKGMKKFSCLVSENNYKNVQQLIEIINKGEPVMCLRFVDGKASARVDFGDVPDNF